MLCSKNLLEIFKPHLGGHHATSTEGILKLTRNHDRIFWQAKAILIRKAFRLIGVFSSFEAGSHEQSVKPLLRESPGTTFRHLHQGQSLSAGNQGLVRAFSNHRKFAPKFRPLQLTHLPMDFQLVTQSGWRAVIVVIGIHGIAGPLSEARVLPRRVIKILQRNGASAVVCPIDRIRFNVIHKANQAGTVETCFTGGKMHLSFAQ